MEPDRSRHTRPAGRPLNPPIEPFRPCSVSWCGARHTDLAEARWITHTADLATSNGGGEQLAVRLVWSQGQADAPSDEPHIVLTVTQYATYAEPLPPGLLQLDRRQAADLARALTSASGPHWLAETLNRAVRLLTEHEQAGATR